MLALSLWQGKFFRIFLSSQALNYPNVKVILS